jgi:hypothetical protein
MGKHYRTMPHKKRKVGSIKCNHVKALYIDQDNRVSGISENDDDKTDFTLIILPELNKSYHPDTTNNTSKQTKSLR